MMENGHSKRRTTIMSFLIIGLIICLLFLCYFLFFRKKVSFEITDQDFFIGFADMTKPGEYDFHSLDAYYDKDSNKYYYNAKYSLYNEVDDSWTEIDDVEYGVGRLTNYFCINWLRDFNTLYGKEEEYEQFKKVKGSAVHKSYSTKEIEDWLKKAFSQK